MHSAHLPYGICKTRRFDREIDECIYVRRKWSIVDLRAGGRQIENLKFYIKTIVTYIILGGPVLSKVENISGQNTLVRNIKLQSLSGRHGIIQE